MGTTLVEAIAVLTAIASGVEGPRAIAASLGITEEGVAIHLEALTEAGYLRQEDGRPILTERLTTLLHGLAGRSDLVAIAGPTILDAEARLGIRVQIEITEEIDPIAVLGNAPFVVRTDARGRRHIATCVVDNADQVACLLRADIEGIAPEALEHIGKELAAVADAITRGLPHVKDRGRPRRPPLRS